jgi:peptidoglycan-associated lipoprotein
MRNTSRMRLLCTAGLLVGSLALFGCPKNPELTKGSPGSVGPGAAATPEPGAPGGAAAPGSQGGDIPVTRPTPPTETPIRPGATAGAATATAALPSPLKDVFFEYDKAVIAADQQAALNENVRWLKANIRVKITIEGHCDERGTTEYNLGLGDRRAKAVRDYLVQSGITSDRISTISYGKERIFVTGHDESAWKQNRRAHFAVAGQ